MNSAEKALDMPISHIAPQAAMLTKNYIRWQHIVTNSCQVVQIQAFRLLAAITNRYPVANTQSLPQRRRVGACLKLFDSFSKRRGDHED